MSKCDVEIEPSCQPASQIPWASLASLSTWCKRWVLAVGNTPGFHVHPTRSQECTLPPPHRGSGCGTRKRREWGEERMANIGKAPAYRASQALLPQKGFHETGKESQLGIVPARKCSLSLKKMQLTSLSLGAASHRGREAGHQPRPWPLRRAQLCEMHALIPLASTFLWPSRCHPGLAHRVC